MLSQQPVSGYNIAVVIIITAFLFYYYYFFFLFQTDIASFCLFVLSGDQLTCMQFWTDFYSVYPVSNHHLTPWTSDIGFYFIFFLGLKLCEMARPGGSRPLPNLACFNIAIFNIKPAVSSVAKRTLSVRELWGSIAGPVKSAQCRQRLATVAAFLRSCVAQALSRGDGPRHSLHASA